MRLSIDHAIVDYNLRTFRLLYVSILTRFDYSYYSVLVATVFLTLDATSYSATEGDPSVQVCVSGSVGTGDLMDIAGQSFEVDLSLSDGTALGMYTMTYMHYTSSS